MLRDIYAMLDQKIEGKPTPAFLISPDDVTKYNDSGHGIFWTVNQFDGKPRKKENISKLNSWFFEIDEGDKEYQLKKIESGFEPSMIIETKRGYHVYFDIYESSSDLEEYRSILVDRLVPFYSADPKACDACRILRVPFTKHQKDPNDIFEIRLISQTTRKYTQKEIEKFYQIKNPVAKERRMELKKILSFQNDNDLFSRIHSMNQAEALQRVSNTEACGMESINFKKNKSGLQIVVNGKPTSSWIDSNFKIGSYERGGPSIFEWINWYHKDPKKTYQFIKKYFPELFV